MEKLVEFARVLKLAAVCFVAIFIVSACNDDNTTQSNIENPEKLTVFIGTNLGCNYDVFANDILIGNLANGIGETTMEDWINNNHQCPYYADSNWAVPYLIYEVLPGEVTIRTSNTWGYENFNQKVLVDKNNTRIFLDYETIKPPNGGDGNPSDSLGS